MKLRESGRAGAARKQKNSRMPVGVDAKQVMRNLPQTMYGWPADLSPPGIHSRWWRILMQCFTSLKCSTRPEPYSGPFGASPRCHRHPFPNGISSRAEAAATENSRKPTSINYNLQLQLMGLIYSVNVNVTSYVDITPTNIYGTVGTRIMNLFNPMSCLQQPSQCCSCIRYCWPARQRSACIKDAEEASLCNTAV